MKAQRQRLLSLYEWGIGVAGILIGLGGLEASRHFDFVMLLYLLVIGVILESMPIPAGKTLSSLMPIIPITVLITQGPASAVLLMLCIATFAMIFQGGSRKLSVKAFNVGQYTISVGAGALVFMAIVGPNFQDEANWITLFVMILATITFTLANHLMVNIHTYMRDLFDWRDVYNVMREFYYYLLTLPVVMLMIALKHDQPWFASLGILPILVLGHVLRIYRKGSLFSRVQQTTTKLMTEFDAERISQEVASAAAKLSYADLVVVYLMAESQRLLFPQAVYPPERRTEVNPDGISVELGGIIWNVLNSSPDSPCEYVPDTRRDGRAVSDNTKSRYYHSMAVYPVRTHGTTYGAVVCYGERAHAFGELTEYVTALTGQFAVLLENAKLYRQLRDQSHRDAATGLYNYRYFYENLSVRLEQAKEEHSPLSVAILDVDHFKALNDTYGHLAGDEVLRSLAQLFRSYMYDGSLVARYGGEEFVFICNQDVDATNALVERVRQAVAQNTVTFDEYQIQGITVSAGIAGYPQHSSDDRDLLAKADSALYWGAKERGRNRTALYTPEFDADLFVDKLTGLYTLHYATIRVREEMENEARRWGAICLDLEHLDSINNALGFDVGDEVLKQISGVIKDHVRQSELACRFGGDEFVILLSDVSEKEIELVADRLTKAVGAHHFSMGATVVVPVRCKRTEFVMPGVHDATALFDRINRTFIELHQRSANVTGNIIANAAANTTVSDQN